ncbi:MAG: hypothetical protein H7Z15_03020 [Rhizobacter sp.]|nr:hypothetical protein [Rhizobacter sp.]
MKARGRPTARSLLVLAAMIATVSVANSWWVDGSDRRLGEHVAAVAKPGDIHMLSSETCAICATARQWFKQHSVPFSECIVERDSACLAAFEARAAPGTPVILVRGRAQLGFSPERVRDGLTLQDL